MPESGEAGEKETNAEPKEVVPDTNDITETSERELKVKEDQYECKECKLKLENEKNLRDHVCKTQKKTECECCGYEFLSAPHLKHHKELITEGALNLENHMNSIPIQYPSEKVKDENIIFDLCDDCGLTMLLGLSLIHI